MCLTFFIQHPFADNNNVRFLIGFNREEQVKRQTLPFDCFKEDSNIYAGRDSISTGTWLGINIKTAVMIFLTNYDCPQLRFGYSRGKLLYQILQTSFLQGCNKQQTQNKINQTLKKVLLQAKKYSPFNLVVFDIKNDKIFYICTQTNMKQPRVLQKYKAHGLCNSDIDTVWKKTQYGLNNFKKIIGNNKQTKQQIFKELEHMFQDNKPFSEDDNDESSIFVDKYYNRSEKADRMTKSTFIGILQVNGEQKTQLTYKEITYQQNKEQKVISGLLQVNTV